MEIAYRLLTYRVLNSIIFLCPRKYGNQWLEKWKKTGMPLDLNTAAVDLKIKPGSVATGLLQIPSTCKSNDSPAGIEYCIFHPYECVQIEVLRARLNKLRTILNEFDAARRAYHLIIVAVSQSSDTAERTLSHIRLHLGFTTLVDHFCPYYRSPT